MRKDEMVKIRLPEWLKIENKRKFNAPLLKDIYGVCGSLYSMNAPYACGYCFCVTSNGREVACGEYVNHPREAINDSGYSRYEYYLDYETKKFYNIPERIEGWVR